MPLPLQVNRLKVLKMLKISDLRRIKKLVFDKIAQASRGQRNTLAVLFKPIDNQKYQIIMSNGEDYGRMVADFTELYALQEFQIAWGDFQKICDLFDKKIDITINGNVVSIKEGKKHFKCSISRSEAWKNAIFKFDFENAFKINMDNCWMLSDLGMMQKFALGQNFLMVTDGNFAGINYLKQNIGEDVHLFTTKIPTGTWFFNPNKRIIVSEDKRVACTYKKAVGSYPYKAMLQLSEQPLNNWLKMNCKEFLSCLEQCSKVDDKITIEFNNNEVNIIAVGENGAFKVSIPAELEHKTPKKEIRFMQKYVVEFCKCVDADGNLTIKFDDNDSTYMARAEKEDLKIFGMGLQVPIKR